MKVSEFLDKTEDKIDYMFRRGKNADERTFDFFLRSVTFFIILIVVLCIASFKVSASGNTLISYYDIDYNSLTNPEIVRWNADDNNKFMNIKMGTEGVEYRNLPSGSVTIQNILYLDSMPSLESNYVLIVQTSGEWEEVWFIPKDYVDSGDMVLYVEGEDVRIYSKVAYTFDLYSVNYQDCAYPDRYRYYGIRSVGAGGSIRPGQFEPAWSYHASWSNAPIYMGNDEVMNNQQAIFDWVDAGMNELYPTMYNANYFNYDTSIMTQPWGNGGYAPESNANHMYAELFNVYISGEPSRKLYSNFDLLYDIQVDEWVVDNMNDYNLNIDYQFVFQGEYIINYNVLGQVTDQLNLRTIANTPYKKSIFELFNEMKSNGKSVNSYLSDISSASDMYLVSKNNSWINKYVYNVMGQRFLENVGYLEFDDNRELVDINNAYLVVTCWLSTEDGQYQSDTFVKKFDFKTGKESLEHDGIMQNNNPYVDPENPDPENPGPDVNNSVNTDGGSIAYAYGGNAVNDIDIQVGNGYQDTALHQLTREDIERNHQKVIDYINHMRGVFEGIGDEIEDDVGNTHASGFIGFLQESYDWIPGVDYITEGIIIIVAIAIIAFIFKCIF